MDFFLKWHVYNRILISNKKEQTTDTYDMDKNKKHYAQWK